MSLGQELSPHLPFLRRYARALMGSQKAGDEIVRQTLAHIVQSPETIVQSTDLRVGLYRVFHDIAATHPRSLAQESREGPEAVAQARLEPIGTLSRSALLLTSLEGFAVQDAASILGVSERRVENGVAEAMAEIGRQTRTSVLIVEDEPIIAMDLETIVRDLGHDVTYVAVTKDDALQSVIENPPGLVLMDIQLSDDSSGIDAAREIRNHTSSPIIFITAFPERLLNDRRVEPTYLVTKPFERSTIKAAISQAVFFGSASLPDSDRPHNVPSDDTKRKLEPISEELVIPRPGPVDARVSAGKLALMESEAVLGNTSTELIEAARKLHYRTARWLTKSAEGSNTGPRLYRRLENIGKCLSRKLTQERSLQLGIQARGLESMLADIGDCLEEANLSDLNIFAGDLVDLARQFPSYRQFVDESLIGQSITAEVRGTASELARTLVDQTDSLVDPALKGAVAMVKDAVEERPDQVSDLALVRTISNVFRAIARFLNRHVKTISQRASDTFDKGLGKTLGSGLLVMVTGSMATLLISLSGALPTEFAFMSKLVELAKVVLGL